MMPVTAAKQRQRKRPTAQTLSGGSVQVWGENVYYEAAGVAEDRPTILFLHEAGGTSATWLGQLVGLAQHARCLVVDLPGHGRSEGMGYTSVAGYRDALIAFLDALALRWPVIVAGVCLGAAVAVDLARQAPDRVVGLVLAGLIEGGRAGEQVRRRTALGEAPEEFVGGLFSHAGAARHLRDRLQRWRVTSPPVRSGDLQAVAAYPLRAGLREVAHPVLMAAGELDPVATPAATAALAAGRRNVRVLAVPDAGCLCMMEQPGLFNQAVSDWVAELEPVLPLEPGALQPGGYRRFSSEM